jgi:hypothetical protein
MPDDLTKRGPADRSRINVNEPWEVKWWAQQLGVTPERLKDAVKQAGPMADKVRQHLGKK